jgi:HD-GYP domain-containing protein (c-di-GMP phosphodiesterase class II)
MSTDSIPLSHIVQMLEEIMRWHKVDSEHGERTARLAMMMGARLNDGQRLNETQLELLGYAARLHDFGRTGIDHAIVNNHGTFTDAERGAMEKHCQIGYNMLKPAHLPVEITLTILHHHENFDGSGYPRGLKGLDIPLFARIVRLCDFWDALRTDRPYRKAYTEERALGVLNEMANKFDPKLYVMFLAMLRDGEI